jgi:hypothetical protein
MGRTAFLAIYDLMEVIRIIDIRGLHGCMLVAGAVIVVVRNYTVLVWTESGFLERGQIIHTKRRK